MLPFSHPHSLLTIALSLIILELYKGIQFNCCGSAAGLSTVVPFTKIVCNLKHVRLYKAAQLLEIYPGQKAKPNKTLRGSVSDKCLEIYIY